MDLAIDPNKIIKMFKINKIISKMSLSMYFSSNRF